MADAPQPCCELEITVWQQPGDAPQVYLLRCDPPGGTHPDAERACALLHGDTDPLAPVPPGVVTTQVYGGPQRATVTGTRHGRPVSATFSRHNGAEMGRWKRAMPLLPAPAAR